MQPLWQLDEELFRAIHVGLHRDWLDGLMFLFTFSGLGYIQGASLLLSAYQGKVAYPTTIVLSLFAAVAASMVEHSPIAFWSLAVLTLFLIFLPRPVALASFAATVLSGVLRLGVVELVARPRPSNLPF